MRCGCSCSIPRGCLWVRSGYGGAGDGEAARGMREWKDWQHNAALRRAGASASRDLSLEGVGVGWFRVEMHNSMT